MSSGVVSCRLVGKVNQSFDLPVAESPYDCNVREFSGSLPGLTLVVSVCNRVLELCRCLAGAGFAEVSEVSYDFGELKLDVDIPGYGRVSTQFSPDDYGSPDEWTRAVMRRVVFPALGSASCLPDVCLAGVSALKGGS